MLHGFGPLGPESLLPELIEGLGVDTVGLGLGGGGQSQIVLS